MTSSRVKQPRRLIVTSLLGFIIVVAVILWFVDLINQWRVFAFLLSAELVAFAMLVYIYSVSITTEYAVKLSRAWLSTGYVALVVLVLLSIVVSLPSAPALKPNVNITLYEGEISLQPTISGFGLEPNNLTSPGPTLNFTVGDVVNTTVYNVGQEPHNWAMVSANQSNAPVLFHAQVATIAFPLHTGDHESVIFTVTEAGDFFYICQIPGHLTEDGMWGRVAVKPS